MSGRVDLRGRWKQVVRQWAKRQPNPCSRAARRTRLGLELLEPRLVLDAGGLQILSHSPTEVRNNRFDFIDLTFSRAINAATFTAEDVTIRGPMGSITPTAIAPLSSTTFRVAFDPLTVRGTYKAWTGPNISDLAGNLLDQDQDGVPGEPDSDVYAAQFVYIDASVSFTSATTLNAGDQTYEGEDILIDGATVTTNGPHSFNSVHLVNGAVLTHSAGTTTAMHKLELTVTEQVIVDSTSWIDVSGKGYLPGRTSGNTTVGAATMGGGGSYGGLGGGDSTRLPSSVYGDYADPDDWGSGGTVGSGGGLVRITAAKLELDGHLLADGASSRGGTGAGGGIYVAVGTLTGSGTIRARGGYDSNGGGGGGGRVAVYAADLSGFGVAAITAPGGPSWGVPDGSAGTVYVRDSDEPQGELIIDAGAWGSQFGIGWTPLGLPGQASVTITDDVTLRGSRTRVRPNHPGMSLTFATLSIEDSALLETSGTITSSGAAAVDTGTIIAGRIVATEVTVVNGSLLTSMVSTADQMHKLDLQVSGALVVDATSRIDVSGKGYLPGRTTGNTTQGGAIGFAGGSYGGLGGDSKGLGAVNAANAAYGDYTDPDDWGSGSGAGDNRSAVGGGLVRITAGEVQLDGRIEARGAGPFLAGAGGGVYVAAGTLSGAGRIDAAGGYASYGGGGGGGRIAVYARDLSGFDLARITAAGGLAYYPSLGYGGAGTVYVLQSRAPTRVKERLPAGVNGGYLERLIGNSVTLRFNRSIDTASFAPSMMTVTGQMGLVRVVSVAEIGDRTYRFGLERSLTEDGPYHFALSAALRDTEGFMLDHNANGIPGEPEDVYSFTLILDTVPPRITNQSPAGDLAGTVSHVDVWFSERIDKTTFTAADVAIKRPNGQAVAVNSIQEIGLNRFRLAFAPQTLIGVYDVRIGPDIRDLAGNQLDQNRDGNFGQPEDIYNASFHIVPVDLGLSDLVVHAAELRAGDPVTISWSGFNRSGAPLLGDWTDGVYLSTDDQWDIGDILLATVPHTGGLAENGTYSQSVQVAIPGRLPGNYRILVRADVANQERETNEANNLIASAAIPLTVRSLTAGTAVNGTMSVTDRVDYYAITLASGESLKLKLHAATPAGRFQLSVSYAAIPTRMAFDQRSATPTADQEVSLTAINGGGTYYVFVYGDEIAGSGAYTLTAELAPFFVKSVTPTRHGNAVPAVVTLTGAGFTPDTVVEFAADTGKFVKVRSEFLADTTLRLSNLPSTPGTYSVRVIQNGRTAELTNAFEITAAGTANLVTNLVVPGAVSPGFPAKQTVWVEYRNTGTVAMPAPLLQVSADGDALLTDREDQANAMMTARSGLVGLGNSVQVLGVGSSATPGLLQPGESGRVAVYYVGQKQDRGARQVTFSLGSLTAMDTTEKVAYLTGPNERVPFERPGHGRTDIIERAVEPFRVRRPDPEGGGRSRVETTAASRGDGSGGGGVRMIFPTPDNVFEEYLRIDWREVLAARPESVPADAWGAIVYNLRHDYFDLWAGYVTELAGTANYLAGIGQTSSDAGALWGLKVADASAALNPVRYLAGAVDASAPAAGLPLTFSRVYGQDIVSRFRIGTLGRGWTHNWDVFANANDAGDVVLHGPGGAERFFARNVNGKYTSSPGDYGRLTLGGGAYTLTESDGTVWRFLADGKLDLVRDTNGNRITLGYVGEYLASLTHSNGQQFLLSYDNPATGDRQLVALTDTAGPGAADDRVTTFAYDARREHLVRVTAPGDRVTEYAYQAAVPTGFSYSLHRSPVAVGGMWSPDSHALVSVAHPDDTHDFFSYDDRGRLVRTSRDGGTEAVSFAYEPLDANAPGRVTVTDATGRKSVLSFGLGGQLAQVRDGDGRIVRFGYDGKYQFSTLTGPGGERYRYAYDTAGNLSGIRDALNLETSFTYEPAHQRLASFTDARGNGIDYQYDARGNLTAIVYEDGSRERFTYDTAGNVLTATNRRDQVMAYTYNTAGQVLTKDDRTTAGIDFTYSYDTHGNLTSAADPAGTTTMTYDSATDRLTRISYPAGQWFAFGYDSAGRRTARTDETGRVVRYSYDAIGRLDRMTEGVDTLLVDYDYDSAGRLQKKTLGNGVFTTYAYDPAGNVTLLTNLHADGTVLSRYGYAYDTSGRRTEMTTLGGTFTYGYDALGQLVHVTHPSGRVVVYDYDAAGNRRAVTDDGVETAYASNTLNQYTRVGDVDYEFDADGNLVSQTEGGVTTIYTYNAENRLVGVSGPDGVWAYRYDALGNRVGVTANGATTTYVIDPTGLGNVAAEYDAGGLVARYDHGYGLLSRMDGAGSSAFYTFQAIGHTSEVTGTGGTVLNSYQYDPFGVSLGKTEAVANPFEYVGEYGVMNESNGLEFMRARFYSSIKGRFSTEDPIGIAGGPNLYAYSNGNPVARIDPYGLNPFEVHSSASTATVPVRPGWGGKGARDFLVRHVFVDGDWGGEYRDAVEQEVRPGGEEYKQYGKEWRFIQQSYIDHDWELHNSGKRWSDVDDSRVVGIHLKLLSSIILLKTPIAPFGHLFFMLAGIARSGDPNDKLAPAGAGDAAFVLPDNSLSYTIRFENQPDATAPAHEVIVTDVLDPNLDLDTFELTEITFAGVRLAVPPGLDHFTTTLPFMANGVTLRIEVTAELDRATRMLTLTLYTTDPATGWTPEDPLLGLLYPEDGSGRGQGSVSYRVRPRAGLPTGTAIENRARIYFDFNDPIDTPLVFNTLDAAAPSSRITTESGTVTGAGLTPITLSWTGEDDQDGSGIATYDVFASVDDDPWFAIVLATAQTSLTLDVVPGSRYSFYTIARDHVGHVEAAPELPDTVITVLSALTVVAGGNQASVEGAEISLSQSSFTYSGDVGLLSGTVDWGDGQTEALVLVAGDGGGTFANGHTYADDGDYLVTLTLSDGGVITISGTLTVIVANALPVLPTLPGKPAEQNVALNLLIPFTDLGLNDTHTATIDWGDGSPLEPTSVVQASGGGQIIASHNYAAHGSFIVTVTVQDNAEGTATRSFTVKVARAASWTNSINRYDVNNDGQVTPLDALLLLNQLGKINRGLDTFNRARVEREPYYDVNEDNLLQPLDALLVLNHLARSNRGLDVAGGQFGLGEKDDEDDDRTTNLDLIFQSEADWSKLLSQE